ncbi:MAG: XdhC family protein [Pseudomonadota bacterium]|nr:XdhC family protein [Pseudomonadota bacterium]
MKKETLEQLLDDQAAKKAVALATDMDNGEQTLVYREMASGPDAEKQEVLSITRQAIQDNRSKVYEIDGRRIFVQVFNPPLRMLIVGAVHIAQPLSRMASVAGYDVTVIDPRASFATDDRFPGIKLNGEWPDDAMRELDPDRRTAVITLTHDPKLDDPGLEVALRSNAFYIGALGSRKTHAGRVERLSTAGFTEREIRRIHAPVGLPIGSISPAEIAISILAQITEVLHRKIEKRAAA